MRILTMSALTLMGTALISAQAAGADFGTLTLKSGETQTVEIATTARHMRVCNDFFSSGPIVAAIDGNIPHDLMPGLCAEDIGARMTVQSHANGLATVDFRPLSDGNGRGPLIEE
jgi:hypothetical protein